MYIVKSKKFSNLFSTILLFMITITDTGFGRGSEGTLPLRLVGDIPGNSGKLPIIVQIDRIRGSLSPLDNITLCRDQDNPKNIEGSFKVNNRRIPLHHICKQRRTNILQIRAQNQERKAELVGKLSSSRGKNAFVGSLKLGGRNNTKTFKVNLKERQK